MIGIFLNVHCTYLLINTRWRELAPWVLLTQVRKNIVAGLTAVAQRALVTYVRNSELTNYRREKKAAPITKDKIVVVRQTVVVRRRRQRAVCVILGGKAEQRARSQGSFGRRPLYALWPPADQTVTHADKGEKRSCEKQQPR